MPEHDQCESADRRRARSRGSRGRRRGVARMAIAGATSDEHVSRTSRKRVSSRSRRGAGCARRAIDGMQPGHAPEDVGADPAGVEPMLVLERTVQRQHAIREVGDRQQCDGRDQRPRRARGDPRRARAGRRRPAGSHRPWVGDRRHLGPQPDVALVQVRSDQRHPRRQRQPHREDDAVDQAAAVGAVVRLRTSSSSPPIISGYIAT